PQAQTGRWEVLSERQETLTLVKERKSYLQKEYKILTEHMNTYMGKVEYFLQENKFLEEEAQRNREESNIYLSYITKHSQKCQNLIITLNDQNQIDLSQVWKQKEKLISQYTEKEKEVKTYLMNMEAKYSLMNKEVEDLQHFKDLQLEQMKKIKELEKELLVTKIHVGDRGIWPTSFQWFVGIGQGAMATKWSTGSSAPTCKRTSSQ
uniref:DUF4515 domain-containing protein n=1 Tax=Anser cygnoides TaxID=8845 RepID=A0A8B9ETY6_ANSCY